MEKLVNSNISDIIFLHGFLGRPSDGFFLKQLGNQFQYHFLDYFNVLKLNPNNDFNNWSENFKKYLSQFQNPLIVGYSLGGRLALNTFRTYDFPLILISSRWGIDDSTDLGLKEKNDRIRSDQIWAQKFLNSDWKNVISEWNQQQVFKGSVQEPKRIESEYDRQLLALALTNWGLPLQPFCIDFHLKKNWIYIIGEHDLGYVERSNNELKQYKDRQFFVAPNSGHRVIFDNPEYILKNINYFLHPNNTSGLRRTL